MTQEPSGTFGEIQMTSGQLAVRKDLSLYYQRWTGPTARSPLVLVHGGGEHLGRHTDTAERLVRAGFAVYAFDLRGHGRSPGIRGHIDRFDDYLDDLRVFIGMVSQDSGRKPVLLGHSLGGLICTCYAAQHPETITCLVLSSALWGLAVYVPLWKRLVAYALSPVWPSLTLDRPKFGSNALSHDPAVSKQYAADPLVHPKASLRLYVETRRKLRKLPMIAQRIHLPVLVLQAGDDHIVSAPSATRIFPWIASQDKTLNIYEGLYHEILHETEKDRVHRDLIEWLHRRVKTDAL